jgi:hypothetical protein
MTEHEMTGKITSGTVRAPFADGQDDLWWEISGLHFGEWECSCGKTFRTQREAAKHLWEEGKRA